ncbi:hypothetical protein BGX27_006456 [Mortierella sp. AM989]|nr:hypothetical protein BGX27_006456 [Mortierella sp. AM989]
MAAACAGQTAYAVDITITQKVLYIFSFFTPHEDGDLASSQWTRYKFFWLPPSISGHRSLGLDAISGLERYQQFFALLSTTLTRGFSEISIVNIGLFKDDGHVYNASVILANNKPNEDSYKAYGPLHISQSFAIYGIGFIGFLSMAPDRGYTINFVTMTVVGVIACGTCDYKFLWWNFLLAIALSAFPTLLTGLIQKCHRPAAQPYHYHRVHHWLNSPDYPITNISSKILGYISMSQALVFVSDLNIDHYIKVIPCAILRAQFVGTAIFEIINLVTANWFMKTRQGVGKDNETFNCPHSAVLYSVYVIWRVIAIDHAFGPASICNIVSYFFLIIMYVMH